MPETQTNEIETLKYPDGTVYTGNCIIQDNKKLKHGFGKITHSKIVEKQSIRDTYEGDWVNDEMNGKGVYTYISGSIYTGHWKSNKHHGKGLLTFSDGSYYDGEWLDHKMHGLGVYVDTKGRKWEGEFVNGSFKANEQKKLRLNRIKMEYLETAETMVREKIAFLMEDFVPNKKEMAENAKQLFGIGFEDEIVKFFNGDVLKWNNKKGDTL